jgi:hypothetical protein
MAGMKGREEGRGVKAQKKGTRSRAFVFDFSLFPLPSTLCFLPSSKERRPAGEETVLANPRTA